MTAAINRSMIVTDADKPLASAITDLFAGSPQHMFGFALSATGEAPVTHWIAAGPVPDGYERLAPWQTWVYETDAEGEGHWVCTERYPGNPKAVYAACQQPISEDDPSPRVPCTLEQIEALFAVSDMTDQDPWVAMGRAGLKPVVVPPTQPLVSQPIRLKQREPVLDTAPEVE